MQLVLLSPNDQMKLCTVNNFSIVSLDECVTLEVIDFDTSDFWVFDYSSYVSCFVCFARVLRRRPSAWTSAGRLARGWLLVLSHTLSARFYYDVHKVSLHWLIIRFCITRRHIIITGFRNHVFS